MPDYEGDLEEGDLVDWKFREEDWWWKLEMQGECGWEGCIEKEISDFERVCYKGIMDMGLLVQRLDVGSYTRAFQSIFRPYPTTSESAGRPQFFDRGDEHNGRKTQLHDGITVPLFAIAARCAVRAYSLLHGAAHPRGSGRGQRLAGQLKGPDSCLGKRQADDHSFCGMYLPKRGYLWSASLRSKGHQRGPINRGLRADPPKLKMILPTERSLPNPPWEIHEELSRQVRRASGNPTFLQRL